MGKTEKELTRFFTQLSEHYRKENDLSNITYSVCKANDEFRRFFLSFCFDEDVDVSELRNFRREERSPNGESRVDFYFFDNQNQERLIEVKIYDQNIHNEYDDNYPNAKKCFLSAYKLCGEREGWKQKTWKQFYLKLKNKKFENDTLIKAYAEYVRNVVGIREFKRMELCLNNLPKFIDNITELLIENHNCYVYYRSTKSFNQYSYGYDYAFNNKRNLGFWMGISLSQPVLYIEFYDKNVWMTKAVRNTLGTIEGSKNAVYSCFYEGGIYYFESKKFEVNDYCTKDMKEQKEILEEFIEAVFKDVGILDKTI